MSRSAPVKHNLLASFTTFGHLLRYLRQRAQLTQRDLALATGYSISQISRLEHNQRLPDELTLMAVFVPALGLEHEPAIVERLLGLARQARAGSDAKPAPPEPSDETVIHPLPGPQITSRLTNLPHRLTSFIGREQEVVALQRLVKDSRLVTLTGVGGVGKSSLALTVAETLTFPDGVWLLELAPLTEGSLVVRALADLFQLPEFPGRTPLEAVIAYLQSKALLLIVDNCEHIIATCADLVERLLRTSATLHILTTSREVLNIAGEREWPVLPLPTPPRTATDLAAWSLPQLEPFAAAQLFIERAQAVKADLSFTDQDAPLIAHLCQQLDGIPLALELAAARCKSFALPELVARLQDRFALLSAGRRTALLRHQTLRATIDWSYELLSPVEAALFRSLAVFAGGWTVAAAEQVADQYQGSPPTFDLLHQLVNKSLVVVDQRKETTRYRMLETIRQYAGEKLQEQGEGETVRTRHYAWCLALLETPSPATLLGARLGQWRDAVTAELDNLRAAFAWSQAQTDRGEKSLRLATAAGPFWADDIRFNEGRTWLESALAHADPENTELIGWALVWLGYTLVYASPRSFDLATAARQRFLALNQADGLALANLLVGIGATMRGELTQAIVSLQEAVAWFETKQSLCFLDWAYFNLANAFVLAGKHAQALHIYRLNFQLGVDTADYVTVIAVLESIAVIEPTEAIALCQTQVAQHRQWQDQARVAMSLQILGRVFTVAGDLPGALAALTESLARWRQLGVLWHVEGGASRACWDLTRVHHLRQEYQAAISYAQKAVQLYQQAGDLRGVANAYVVLGYPALASDDLRLALSSFQQSLQLAMGKDFDCTYMAVVGLAEIAHRQEDPVLAARLSGIAERFAKHFAPMNECWKESFCKSVLTVVHTQFRDGAYAAAWAEGQAMPLDRAMQLTLTL